MSRLIRATSLQGIDHLIAELGGDLAAIMQQCAINVDFNKLEQETLTYRAYAQLLEHCANTLNCKDVAANTVVAGNPAIKLKDI